MHIDLYQPRDPDPTPDQPISSFRTISLLRCIIRSNLSGFSYDEKRNVRLSWEGKTTLPKLHELVRTRVNFELQLPPDYHFALSRHLLPHATPNESEQIDLAGTAELLNKVAEIRGLHELVELAGPVGAAEGRVHIQSPAPGILVTFPTPT